MSKESIREVVAPTVPDTTGKAAGWETLLERRAAWRAAGAHPPARATAASATAPHLAAVPRKTCLPAAHPRRRAPGTWLACLTGSIGRVPLAACPPVPPGIALAASSQRHPRCGHAKHVQRWRPRRNH